MRKILILLSLLLLFPSCEGKAKNITFTAVIESVNGNNIMVTTTDVVGFDKASVSFDEKYKPDFTLSVGQSVLITVLPEIRESYPVQATAIKIVLKEQISSIAVYKKITAAEAKAIIDSDSKVIILDVRTQIEYDGGHIKNALLLPDTEIEQKAENVLPNKNAKILVYCRSGNRSATATRKLIEMGYTNVLDFGGIIDWTYEIVK